ncbi:MAG: hypothetical protein J6Y90_06590 [Lachnospiraceae bacterium]|nr:hypothetical protein [Lachnospiraceae bacterium]
MNKLFNFKNKAGGKKRSQDPYYVYGTRRKKSRLFKLTYLQVVFAMSAVALLLLLFAFIRSVMTNGESGVETAISLFFSFLLGLGGAMLTLYGHSYVRLRGKIPWQAGLWCSGFIIGVNCLIAIIGMLP